METTRHESLPPTQARERTSPQPLVLLASVVIILGLVGAALTYGSHRHAFAVLIGVLAGLSLYLARFGFTAAWRRAVVEHRGAGLRAQFLLLALVCAVSFPLLAQGNAFGISVYGYILPFGVSAALGAFMFGVGMQLGGGCASGTLFTVGGGSVRMVIVLAFFVLGSVIATAHMPFWRSLPSLPPVSFIKSFGLWPALALVGAILLGLTLLSVFREKRAHGVVEWSGATISALQGPWSYRLGACMIALVCLLTFVDLGRPWGISSGFALWGAKLFHAVGIDVLSWPYWSARSGEVERSVFAHSTSLMNFGIIAGAFIAAGLAGKFAPAFRIEPQQIMTAILGGLLLGYGARLSYGCNIGAYLGGVTSGSLHGWLWMVFAYAGSAAAIHLKRRLKLA
ncbi:YeeE/YedE family protein [Rhodobacteraceae bacterium RKSG542]|uniref:YeeE/YedE family protein n=1 Tax=Pseudovibrio flavus TaxID=2529854 RepID=UPI0012BBB073|nr:YeeE/YedE family protein [Pseudovibrio flavus]MTI17695.1 YeeE/YedE family protein [Pseudovibrio flavus]